MTYSSPLVTLDGKELLGPDENGEFIYSKLESTPVELSIGHQITLGWDHIFRTNKFTENIQEIFEPNIKKFTRVVKNINPQNPRSYTFGRSLF